MGKISEALQAKKTNMQQEPKQVRPVDKLKTILATQSVQEQFKNALQENANIFIASLVDLFVNDKTLQACEPQAVVMEALKAATLKLPINKQLGFAYILPYKHQNQYIPQFQLGYKGYLQLAMRTGIYKYINADVVYEGELVSYNKITGELVIDAAAKKSENVIGYFAYMETINGFRKSIYMTKEQVIEHAKKYSKSYNSQYSAWQTDFDMMAIKTCLRLLISKYGLLSIDVANAVAEDLKDFEVKENEQTEQELEQNKNYEIKEEEIKYWQNK